MNIWAINLHKFCTLYYVNINFQYVCSIFTRFLTPFQSILPSFRNFDSSRCHTPSVWSSWAGSQSGNFSVHLLMFSMQSWQWITATSSFLLWYIEVHLLSVIQLFVKKSQNYGFLTVTLQMWVLSFSSVLHTNLHDSHSNIGVCFSASCFSRVTSLWHSKPQILHLSWWYDSMWVIRSLSSSLS